MLRLSPHLATLVLVVLVRVLCKRERTRRRACELNRESCVRCQEGADTSSSPTHVRADYVRPCSVPSVYDIALRVIFPLHLWRVISERCLFCSCLACGDTHCAGRFCIRMMTHSLVSVCLVNKVVFFAHNTRSTCVIAARECYA